MQEKQENFTLLNGRVKMVRGIYNPTCDAVWLAASAPKDVKNVLDVGIGTGGVSLCLASRNRNAEITGIDISDKMLAGCRKNMELNKKEFRLLNADILNWSTQDRFDLVITNPPYFNGTPAKHNAHHNVNIKDWTKRCCARVKPKGLLCMITDTLCLNKIISVLNDKHFGDIQIFPLFGSKNSAERVIIRARAASRAGTTIFRSIPMNSKMILRDGLTIDALLSKLGAL